MASTRPSIAAVPRGPLSAEPWGRLAATLAGGAAPARPAPADEALRLERSADRRDVQAVLGGDGDAYGRIVARHQGRVTALMHRFTRDRGVLEELVQDVFVEAYGSLGGWRADAPLGAWLRRIAVRVGYRHWTARERHPEPLPDGWDAPTDDRRADERDLATWLHGQLARLSARDRLVLTLTALEQHSIAEVAALTGWSRSAVKVAAHRARKRLAALLGEDGPGPEVLA